MSRIQWLSWGKDAFEKAKAENKPVILSIFGTWCHWCRQMDSKAYSDADVIKRINESFIPIQVNADKRPDINERYNQGGWPSTVFMTADGKIITGATYVSPKEMLSLLHQVAEYHEINEGIVGEDKIYVERAETRKHFGISDKISGEILSELIENFDTNYGGFGYEPKFPLTDAIEFLLIKYKKNRDKNLLKMVETTLDGMIGATINKSGLFDNVEGGFFRCSVAHDWSIPHYEKVLETNARLLINYLDAYQLTRNTRYRDAIEKTVGYIKNYLSHPDGGFCGSQNYDDEYYGRSLEERKKMNAPSVDKTIYVNWNAMMASAFIKAYIVLNIEYCRAFALKTIDFLMRNCYSENGMCHYYDTGAHVHGLASDNLHMIKVLLDAYELTADRKYLEYAERLSQFLLKKFNDNGFFDRLPSDGDAGYLKARKKLLAENSLAAENFLRLGIFLANEDYKKVAEKTLEAFVNDYQRYGMHASPYAAAIENFLDPIEIVIITNDANIHLQLLRHSDSRKIVQALSVGDELAKKKGYKKQGIYICKGAERNSFDTAEEALQYLENN